MYRDIFQWINSIFKKNYGGKGTPNLIYSRNKIIRISSKKTGNRLQLHKPCSINGYYFKDLIHLHKFYFFNYLKLITSFENVIRISYSKLLLPNRFNYLSEKLIKFNITLNKINLEEIIQKPAKTHGNPVENIEQAIEKNKNIKINFQKKILNI